VATLRSELLLTAWQAYDLALLGTGGLDRVTRAGLRVERPDDGHAVLPAGGSLVTPEVVVSGRILARAVARAAEDGSGGARLRITVLAGGQPLWSDYVEFFR
jgi:hypothetical protein